VVKISVFAIPEKEVRKVEGGGLQMVKREEIVGSMDNELNC
jgi:hypothetical protein